MNQIPTVSVNIMGGLGNQLFQIAAAYAYARQTGGRFLLFKKKDNGNRPVYWDTLLYKIQPYLVPYLAHDSMTQWNESLATMYKEIGPLPSNGIFLKGYLQTSKYYQTDSIKNEIKELFRPSLPLTSDVNLTYSHLIENKDRVVVIHSRRTDYITAREFHGPLEGSYYKEAVRRIVEKVDRPIFVMCGDDPAFWNEIRDDIALVYDHENMIVEDTDIRTYALLQQFHNFIMSNSTFIWWCVWMADAKHVMAPSKWFGPAGPQLFSDIYEENWEIVPC